MTAIQSQTIGFIGLGAMGFPMAQNIAKKLSLKELIVFDVNTHAMEQLATEFPKDVKKGSSAREVMDRSDIIITMLPEGKHVRSVYMGPDTQLDTMDLSDKTFIDCSTIDVETSLAVKDFVVKLNSTAAFYDSPVSGAVEGAAAGTLAFFVGIEEDDKHFASVQKVLLSMGAKEKIVACGPASSGLVAKISHNYLAGVLGIAACETMNLGIRAGLDPKVLYRVLVAGAARNPLVQNHNPVPGLVDTAPSSNGYKAGFRTALMAKDVGLGVQLAETYNSKLVLGAPCLATYKSALPDLANLDFTSVYRLFSQ